MKRRSEWIQIIALVITILVFVGYMAYSRIKTDDMGPAITIDGTELTLSVNDPQEAYLRGVSAYDDQDGDVSSQIVVESCYGITDDNLVTVTYAAFDRAGNVTKAKRLVLLTDYHAPVFTLAHSLTFPSSDNLDIMDYVGATDLLDGDVVRRVRATLISNSGSLSDEGIHDVLLRVTNSIGDSAELILPVEIYAPEKYNAALELDSYLLYISQGTPFRADAHLKAFSFAGESISFEAAPEDLDVSVSGTVNIQVPGIYPVRYTAQYLRNNTTYKAYSKLFVIVDG